MQKLVPDLMQRGHQLSVVPVADVLARARLGGDGGLDRRGQRDEVVVDEGLGKEGRDEGADAGADDDELEGQGFVLLPHDVAQ